MFVFEEHKLKKVSHDTLARADMDSYRKRPSNFLLLRPEHAHASYPVLFFSPVQGLDYPGGDLGSSKTTGQNK
mgnify:CR=1 FL=1